MTSPTIEGRTRVPPFGVVQWTPGQVHAYARAAGKIHSPSPRHQWGLRTRLPFVTRARQDCAHCSVPWPCDVAAWRRTVLTPELLRARGRHSSRRLVTSRLGLAGMAVGLALTLLLSLPLVLT